MRDNIGDIIVMSLIFVFVSTMAVGAWWNLPLFAGAFFFWALLLVASWEKWEGVIILSLLTATLVVAVFWVMWGPPPIAITPTATPMATATATPTLTATATPQVIFTPQPRLWETTQEGGVVYETTVGAVVYFILALGWVGFFLAVAALVVFVVLINEIGKKL